ncbi:hypothetical protein RB195_006662 [Necator americanus]|uniref:Schlafen AlbA-2 domain-containing protein n=1 Tax=Necator americanus TaxID=51031 RepID=A0ABR1BV29_NECAM
MSHHSQPVSVKNVESTAEETTMDFDFTADLLRNPCGLQTHKSSTAGSEFIFDDDILDGEENDMSGVTEIDDLTEVPSISDAKESSEIIESRAFTHCSAPNEERSRDVFGRCIPKYRTAWRIVPDQPCLNYNVLTAEVIPSSDVKSDTVELPAELVLSLEEMHCRELQGSQEIFKKLFSGKPKKYFLGDTLEVASDVWTLFWDPHRIDDLTTFTVQSTICAALNSRRRLAFIIGIGPNKQVVGCELSQKQRETMHEVFEFCTTTEFVPPLDRDLVRLRFFPVCDSSGCEIPSRFIAEVSINDKVTTLYQLSSGRIYYADGSVVVRTRTFSDACRMLFLRRKAELNEALKEPLRRLKRTPCLRVYDELSDSSNLSSVVYVLLLSLPGVFLGYFASDFLRKISVK